jgi:Uma2 family endonuclease
MAVTSMAELKTETPSRVPPKERMTFEEYVTWADEDTWPEWIGGRVELLPRVTSQHQELLGFFIVVLGWYVREKKIGEILQYGYLMHLPQVPSGRLPDLLFVRTENADRFQEYYCNGPADLVVEIVSPESIGRDRGDKFAEYEEGGVPEYWLIDPIRKRAEFYQLDETARYQVIEPAAHGIYRSKVVDGFWLRVGWLWQDPLPLEEEVLKEIRQDVVK